MEILLFLLIFLIKKITIHCIVLIHVQHYIHGSSQGQFIVETYIVIFLRILLSFYLVAVLFPAAYHYVLSHPVRETGLV